MRYVRQFNIPYESIFAPAIPNPPGDALYHLQGQRLRVSPGASVDSVDWPYELTDEERALGPFGILQTYLLSLFDGRDSISEPWSLPDWVIPHDQKSLLELTTERGASPGALALIRATTWFGERSAEVSAASTLMADLALTHDVAPLAFPGGADTLPRAFAERLGERIRYGSEVLRIGQDNNQVEIVVRAGNTQNRITADRAICTVPFSVPSRSDHCVVAGNHASGRSDSLRWRAYVRLEHDHGRSH